MPKQEHQWCFNFSSWWIYDTVTPPFKACIPFNNNTISCSGFKKTKLSWTVKSELYFCSSNDMERVRLSKFYIYLLKRPTTTSLEKMTHLHSLIIAHCEKRAIHGCLDFECVILFGKMVSKTATWHLGYDERYFSVMGIISKIWKTQNTPAILSRVSPKQLCEVRPTHMVATAIGWWVN